jgi:hypothetical protein
LYETVDRKHPVSWTAQKLINLPNFVGKCVLNFRHESMKLVRLSQRKSFYSYSIHRSALWADVHPADRKQKTSYNFFFRNITHKYTYKSKKYGLQIWS